MMTITPSLHDMFPAVYRSFTRLLSTIILKYFSKPKNGRRIFFYQGTTSTTECSELYCFSDILRKLGEKLLNFTFLIVHVFNTG